jgi:hypothetical protein
MASASTSVGPFTLKAVQQYPDNTFVYTLSTPDGPAVIGSPSDFQLGATTGGHVSGNSNLTIVNVGQASFELTNEEAVTLVSSFGQMYQTVSAEAQQQLTTLNPSSAVTTGDPATTAPPATVAPQSSPPPTADAASQNAASLEAQAAAQQPVPQADITSQNDLLTLQQSGTTTPPPAELAINPPDITSQNDLLTLQQESVPTGDILIPPVDSSALDNMPIQTISAPPDVPSPTDNEIDIYDPNLTPAQLATLSPGDINARNAALGTGPFKVAPTDSEGNIVVSAKGITGKVAATQASATAQDQAMFAAKVDWRVRLSLAPGSSYLYNSNNPGILKPLSAKDGTDGVIFPYTPQIQVSYAAKYSTDTPTHSNYAINQYTSSAIDSVAITGDFTAQDVSEANYLLAVIHFFRTMTKMFYGQDQNPKPGTPPPLCYMYGMGDYQFSAHPLAITNFTYSLPNDVDYIKTQAPSPAGSLQNAIQNVTGAINRLGAAISPGGTKPPANYGASQQSASIGVTWVPTKIQLSITCLPIISRNQISNQFSLADYASGKLLAGTRRPGGGMW